MRRRSILLLAAVVIGCQSAIEPFTLAPTDANVTGTFHLTISDGRSLPVVYGVTATQEIDIAADTMVIVNDGTWKETTYYTLTAFSDNAVSTTQSLSSGTYTVANGQINFVIIVGGPQTFTGSVSGNTLSVLFNGARFFYSR